MDAATIVVVDDNRDWLDEAVEALTREGYSVRTAANGADGSTLLSLGRPKLVVLGLQLSGISGMRLLREFRQRDSTTPILAVSRDDRASLREQAMAGGANGFLHKPIMPSTLASAVRRLLPGRKPPASANDDSACRPSISKTIRATADLSVSPVRL